MFLSFTTTDFNSSPPSVAHMHQWIWSALVQIMACCLFGVKPLSKPMLCYRQLDTWKQTSVNFNKNTKLFIDENSSENIVCETAVILSRERWVKHLCRQMLPKHEKWKYMSLLYMWAMWKMCKQTDWIVHDDTERYVLGYANICVNNNINSILATASRETSSISINDVYSAKTYLPLSVIKGNFRNLSGSVVNTGPVERLALLGTGKSECAL